MPACVCVRLSWRCGSHCTQRVTFLPFLLIPPFLLVIMCCTLAPTPTPFIVAPPLDMLCSSSSSHTRPHAHHSLASNVPLPPPVLSPLHSPLHNRPLSLHLLVSASSLCPHPFLSVSCFSLSDEKLELSLNSVSHSSFFAPLLSSLALFSPQVWPAVLQGIVVVALSSVPHISAQLRA